MKFFKKAKRGFTLVELVVVIAVIAILAAVSVGAYFGVTESANNSRLEQETKQLHTAIQTISLGNKTTQSMSKNGLIISNEIAFDGDLDEALGTDYDVFVGETPNTVAKPTVVFKTAAFTKNEVGQPTVYKTFEYYNPEINGKYVEADVVTGDFNILKNDNVSVDTTADMRTLYYVDHPTFSTENPYVYMWDSENNPAVAWPGDQILSLVGTYDTYEENETVNVYKFTVDVNKFTNFIFNHGNNQPQTVNCSYDKTSSNNAFAATGSTTNEEQYTVDNTEYILGEWNYGRFLELGEEAPTDKYYFIDAPGFKESTSEIYVHVFNKDTGAAAATWPGTPLSAIESIDAGTNGTLNVYDVDIDRAIYDTVVFSSVEENNEEKTVVWQTIDLQLTNLDNNQNNLFAVTQRFDNDNKYIAVEGSYVQGQWNYNQFVIEVNSKDYYFLDQKFFHEDTLSYHVFSSVTGEVVSSYPGAEFSGQPTVINTATYGSLYLYKITVNRALYDTVTFSNNSYQTIDINLDTADTSLNNLFALNDEVVDDNKYTVVNAVFEGGKWDYGQTMREVPVDTDLRTYYFDATPWLEANAKISCFTKKDGKDIGTWPGTPIEKTEYWHNLYKIEVDLELVDTIIFNRVDPNNTSNHWGGQTVDIKIKEKDYPTNTLFTLKEQKIATNLDVEVSKHTEVAFEDYNVYFASTTNNWVTNNEEYKLSYDNEEYSITTIMPINSEFKLVFNDGTNDFWCGNNGNNFVIDTVGEYKITASKTGINYEKIGDFDCEHTGHWDNLTGKCKFCGVDCNHDFKDLETCTICGVANPELLPKDYNIYVFDDSSWGNNLKIHLFDGNTDAETTWPGTTLQLVGDRLYKFDTTGKDYKQFIINKNGDSAKTNDLKIENYLGKVIFTSEINFNAPSSYTPIEIFNKYSFRAVGNFNGWNPNSEDKLYLNLNTGKFECTIKNCDTKDVLYKITQDGTWDKNWGANGAANGSNISFSHTEGGSFIIEFSEKTKKATAQSI